MEIVTADIENGQRLNASDAFVNRRPSATTITVPWPPSPSSIATA